MNDDEPEAHSYNLPSRRKTEDPYSETRARIAHELHEGVKVEQIVTVTAPRHEVFMFWRNFRNLPKFMRHLKEIEVLSPLRTKWTWQTLAGVTLEWESEIIAEIEDRMISWQTTTDSLVNQAGSVWFRSAPQDGATEVHVQLMYRLPGGKLARKVAELLGEEPSQTLREDLRRLRWLLEAGEIPTTDRQPRGEDGILH